MDDDLGDASSRLPRAVADLLSQNGSLSRSRKDVTVLRWLWDTRRSQK